MTPLLSALIAGIALSFSHITVEQGLSQNTVVSVCQDPDGNMWFSTNNGLNRYDGYDLTVFRHDDADPGSIADNLINKVFTDTGGTVWIGTEIGLSSYDPLSESFFNTSREGMGGVMDIAEVSPGHLLVVTTSRKLMAYDRLSDLFTPVDSPDGNLNPTCLYSIAGSVYVGCFRMRLFRYDTTTGTLESVDGFRSEAPVSSITARSDTELWVGTEGAGLYLFNTATKENRRLTSNPIDRVRALCYDLDGRLWIGGRTGLGIYDEHDGGKLQMVGMMPQQPDGLSYESVKALFRDTQGGIWVGTYFGGVNYWHSIREKFRNITPLAITSQNANKIVSTISLSPEGDIWLGTNSGGISLYDPDTGIQSCPDDIRAMAGIRSDDIKAIWFSPDKRRVFIATHGSGTAVLDRRNGRITRINRPVDVYSIIGLPDGRMLLGSLAGLYEMDPDSYAMKKITCTSRLFRIYTLLSDKSGRIWAGGKDGLNVFSQTADGSFSNVTPEEFSAVRQVLCIHEASDWTIWIGTMGGLWAYDRKNGRLSKVSTEGRLDSASALSIEEDSFGRLWIGTYQGIFCYNPATGEERQYSERDGLEGRQFSNNASCRTSSGLMAFGSINGLTLFNPESIKPNMYSPKAVISGMQLYGKPVHPGDETGILTESISKTSSIRLKHNQNTISFSFSVPNYISGQHNSFSYRMEGADNDWTTTTRNRSTTYSHLGKGHYRFNIRVANNDGLWCPQTTTLDIRVMPVWYKSTFAEVIFLLLLLSAAFWTVKSAFIRQKSENELRIRKLNEAHQEEVKRMKALAYSENGSISESDEKLILRVLDLLEQNISNPEFSVSGLASLMNMSRSNLNLRIKAATGASPLDLLRKYRFNEACRLLKEGNLTIAQVSDRTGFSSPSYFTASFRDYFGCSPSEFQDKK